MTKYHGALICLNGHCKTAYYYAQHDSDSRFCETCGAENISLCPACDAPIRGKIDDSGFVDATRFTSPSYCYNCGKPYPWTQSAIEAAAEMIQDDDSMQQDEKDKLVSSLPDIVSESPKTQLAAARFKKAMSSAGRFTADFLRQFAIDFGSEVALKALGIKQ